jgi:hypothetical protein
MRKKLSSIIVVGILMLIFIILYVKSFNKSNEETQFETGVNIHFIEPNNYEVNELRGAGFSIVRMDLIWSDIEKEKGKYNFSQYDKLVNCMDKNNIKILFILDYGNPLYDNGMAPFSDNGREAFSNFAKEAVKHYTGKQIMWEIWNEPNGGAWSPKANVNDYYKLAITTINKMRLQNKNTFIVAPALSGFDYSYLNYLGKDGLFKYIDAISVHPYREKNPETVIMDYGKLLDLIDKYPHNKNIKIFSGEWGYSSSNKDINESKQAQYCIREYLTNIICGVDLSIWYDWKNDGNDFNNSEQNFGTVKSNLKPKLTYYAIKTMTSTINGFKYIDRINVGSKNDYILMFKKGNRTVYALWTAVKNHSISINLSNNKIKIIDLIGNSYEKNILNNKCNIELSGNVKYIIN